MLIADGGSEEDTQTGYALSGYNEKVLSNFLKSNGLNYNDSYRTILIKERINLAKPMANLPLVTEQYKKILADEIIQINPNIIVPLSELSFNFTTNLSGIRKFRGSVLPCKAEFGQKRVIPILGNNPYINEDPKMEFISRLDFRKVFTNLDIRGAIPEYGLCWVCKDDQSLRAFIDRQYASCIGRSLAEVGFLVCDIESYCGIPTCISLCFDGKESVTIPFLEKSISLDSRVLMVRTVAMLLADKRLPKVNQNIPYDWKHLEQFLFRLENVSGDTMLAANILNCEFPKDLGFLNSLYTDMPYFKDEGKEFDPSLHESERLYIYCAKDSLATHQIHTQQIEEMKSTNTYEVYQQTMAILPVYRQMGANGIRIDEEKRQSLIVKYTNLFDIEVYKFQALTEKKNNPLSDQQVRRIVYDELGYKKIPGVKTTKGGQNGTDEESLEVLMFMGYPKSIQDTKTILKTVINCRKLHKVIEYVEALIHPDGRARCSPNLAGAETGRTTTSKTTDYYLYIDNKTIKRKNIGRSFQNIGKHGFEVNGETLGKDIRSMFIPSYGYVFVESDLSKAESYVDAVLAEDWEMIENMSIIHNLTGSWIYDCDPADIKKKILVNGEDRYHTAKTARHAGERNMKPMRLMMMIHQPIKYCTNILSTFHKRQPNIQEVFHRDIREAIRKTRHLHAPNGRKRDFYGRFDDHMVNEGISFLPQAIVTDYLKKGIRKIFCDSPIREWARSLSEAHDGFLVEVPAGRQEEYGSSFKKAVEDEIDFRTCSLPRDYKLVIPCETEWSDTNWKEMVPLIL